MKLSMLSLLSSLHSIITNSRTGAIVLMAAAGILLFILPARIIDVYGMQAWPVVTIVISGGIGGFFSGLSLWTKSRAKQCEIISFISYCIMAVTIMVAVAIHKGI